MLHNIVSSSKSYRPEIDGLRAIAVICVIINHFNNEVLPNGFLGVDIFFVISGYVITSSLANREHSGYVITSSLANREHEHLGDFLLSFYARRIKRLMPGLVVCIAITSLVGFLFISPTSEDFVMAWQTAIAALFGLSNLYLLKQSTDYFAASTELNLFTQTWSLGVEEQFYLIFPFILWFTGFIRNHSSGKKNLFFSITLLSAVSFCTYVWLSRVNQPAAYFLMPSRFWELGLGCITFLSRFWELGLGCITFLTFQLDRTLAKLFKSVSPLLITALIIVVLCLPQVSIYKSTISIVVLTSLLIGTLKTKSIVYKVLTWKPVLFVGLISYSLYLWHWSILSISRWTVGIHWLTLPIQLGLIILLSLVSYKYIELPLRYSKWPKSRVKTIGFGLSISFACTCLLFVLGKPFKGLLYTGKEANLIKKGVSTLTDQNYWNGRVVWSGEKCILASDREVGKIIKPESCTFGLIKDIRFLVIGNSFSAAEIEMYKVLVEKGLGAVTVTSSWGASPVREVPNDSSWSKANDYYWSSVVPGLISNLRKGDIVIMVNDIAGFAPCDIVIMVNDIAGFAPLNPSPQSEESLKIFHDGLNNFAKLLSKKGIGVIFQSVNPFLRESGCVPDVALTDLSLRQLIPFKGISACNYYTKTESLKRRAPIHNMLIDLERTNSNFKVLDLFYVLCPGTECSYFAHGNKFMYRDIYSHLSVEGNIYSQAQLLKAVNDLKVKMQLQP